MSANELFTYPTYPNPTFQTTAMFNIYFTYVSYEFYPGTLQIHSMFS